MIAEVMTGPTDGKSRLDSNASLVPFDPAEPFDYAGLADDVRATVIAERDAIRKNGRKSCEATIAIGQSLRKVKETLPHGQFGPWIAAEFDLTPRTAQRFMKVAEYAEKNDIMSHLPATTVYQIASGALPNDGRQTANPAGGADRTTSTPKKMMARDRPDIPADPTAEHLTSEPPNAPALDPNVLQRAVTGLQGFIDDRDWSDYDAALDEAAWALLTVVGGDPDTLASIGCVFSRAAALRRAENGHEEP